MEKNDLDLIQQHLSDDQALAVLYDEHVAFERELEKYNRKPFLTPNDEVERKNLQKKKLVGRDRIEFILSRYRTKESLS